MESTSPAILARTVVRRGLVFAAAFVLVLGQWSPLALTQLGSGLDPSWIAIVGEAAAGRYALGRDFTFTFGPLAPLYTTLFHPRTFGIQLAAAYFVVGAVSLALSTLLLASRNRLVVGAMVFVLFTPLVRDALFLFAPLPLALLAIGDGRRVRNRTAFAVLAALVSATLSLAKFSVVPVVAVLLPTIDVVRVRRKEVPVASFLFVAAFVVGFHLLGGERSEFSTYLRGSLDAAAHFSDAMGLRPPPLRLAMLGAMWLSFSASIVLFCRSARRADESPARAVAPVLMLVGLGFVSFKAGFVRADDHTLIAFDTLPLAVGSVLLVLRVSQVSSAPAVIAMIASTFVPSVDAMDLAPEALAATPFQTQLAAVHAELHRSGEALVSPSTVLSRLRRDRALAIASVASTSPFVSLDGPVATVPSIQSSLLAAGLDLRLFPSGQQYHAYSAWVIARDRAFLSSEGAPKYVIVAPEELDERFPGLTEGPLWGELLARYEPVDAAEGTLLLSKRRAPVPVWDGAARTQRGRLEVPLELPTTDAPLFLRVDVERTAWGSLMGLAYKTPLLWIEATFVDGRKRRWRLVPAIAREGFVVTPMVESDAEMLLLFAGEARTQALRSITIVAGSRGRSAYRPEFTYSVRRLNRRALEAARIHWSRRDRAFDSAAKRLSLVRALDADGGASDARHMVREGLLLYPPSRLSTDVGSATRLEMEFGMDPAMYGPSGRTDGVCVRIRTTAGAPLFERCLTPRERETDRGWLRASVALPEGVGTVRIETTPVRGSGWNRIFFRELDAH